MSGDTTAFRWYRPTRRSALDLISFPQGDVPSIKALEGFTLGIGGVGSLDHSMTRLVLAAHGIDVEKVKMVALGEPHVRALALSTRRIDATTMSIGTWSRFRDRPGLKVLLSDEDYFNAAPVLNKVIVAEQNVLAARGPAVERFVAALVKASRAFAADPGAWVEAMRHARRMFRDGSWRSLRIPLPAIGVSTADSIRRR